MAGMNAVRSINQSLMRGGEHFQALYSYNPPRSRDNWTNREVLRHRDDRLVHDSTYLDVPRAWLGEHFIAEAEELERTNEAAYRHEYLGDVTGTGGSVFDNVTLRTITADERKEFDRPMSGVDWGWWPDPFVYGRMHLDAARRTLYIFDSFSTTRTSNADNAAKVKTRLGDAQYSETVTCDSAEPKSIEDFRSLGIDARPALKGPGSVAHGMKWLASLASIVIDPETAPLAAEEFPMYQHEQTRDGEYTSNYPDENNHSIDLTRYACGNAIARYYR